MKLFFFSLVFVLLAGCVQLGTEITAQQGDVVFVDYVGALRDGTVFDTSLQSEAEAAGLSPRPVYEPLQFTIGAGQVIRGFESGVVGMKKGEEKTITIPPEEAYGQPSEELIVEISRQSIDGDPEVGDVIEGGGRIGRVVELTSENVVVDFNHQLAGKTLIFRITLREIQRG